MIRKYHNHNCRQTHYTARKSRKTITRHQEDKLSKKKQLSLSHKDDFKTRMDIQQRTTKQSNYRIPQWEKQSTTYRQ